MTDPQSGRTGPMEPGRADGVAGAVQSTIAEDQREQTSVDPQANVEADPDGDDAG